MGIFSFHEAKKFRDSLYDNEHDRREESHRGEPKLSHEIIGGAAAFEGLF